MLPTPARKIVEVSALKIMRAVIFFFVLQLCLLHLEAINIKIILR